MGASLIDIKKRIDSTKMTMQITSAMQMVSAAKLNRSEQYMRKFHEYSHKIYEIVAHLAKELQSEGIELSDSDDVENTESFIDFRDMLIQRPIKKTGYLVISASQGLAGNYNSSLFNATLNMLKEDHKSHDEFVLMTIGSAAQAFFAKAGIEVDYQLESISDFPSFDEVRSIIVKAVSMFRTGEFDVLYVCYNHHVNAMMSMYRAEQFLPLTNFDDDVHDGVYMFDQSKQAEYIFEPSKEAVLARLLPQFAESAVYESILDAKTAEHAARMIAMRSATDNASKLIDELKKIYNQQRQSAITQEITEIVGGASALGQ
ncbi:MULTISPECIES: ATP synthase F1 subunit gamma [unclassified Granulicatella]|uniref:ATP synthase F1 subunit gamma n=1 Tax=unclassified Granulicatella TaxID=2630493 RepID=UPI0010739BC5|nr:MULTISPECIES: ATP synthase F1 subunit gamma [unclassified Granulicatella]MBF0780854.1 ATP synthase F1 subunit gamma [Granulicatella sp. 19428wC4_WM01]TFU93492.1 ATP synthase F1 subunit gamma [Granulicatella sp. WM01]